MVVDLQLLVKYLHYPIVVEECGSNHKDLFSLVKWARGRFRDIQRWKRFVVETTLLGTTLHEAIGSILAQDCWCRSNSQRWWNEARKYQKRWSSWVQQEDMDKELLNGRVDSGVQAFRGCPYQKTSHSIAVNKVRWFKLCQVIKTYLNTMQGEFLM